MAVFATKDGYLRAYFKIDGKQNRRCAIAIAGAGGWKPSNIARLRNGQIEFIAITQNKPPELIVPLEEAVMRLLAGELVTVDARWPYMSVLRSEVEQRRPTVAKSD